MHEFSSKNTTKVYKEQDLKYCEEQTISWLKLQNYPLFLLGYFHQNHYSSKNFDIL